MAMDPVTQTLAQQQGGSAGGEGFGSYFVQGRQLGLAQKRLALEERQVKVQEREQDMILPLRRDVMKAQAISLGAEAIVNVNKAMGVSQSNAGMAELTALELEFARSPLGHSDPALINKAELLSQKYSLAFGPDAPGGKLMTAIKGATYMRDQFRQIREMNEKLTGTGTIVRQVSPNVEVAAASTGATDTADIRNTEYLQQLKARVAAFPEGTPERAAAQDKLATFQEATAPRGFIVRTNADGSTEVIQGPQSMQTTAQTGRLRESAAYAVDAAKRIEDLKPILSSVFGPGNAVGDIIVDRGLANFAPELMDKTRVKGREAAGYLKNTIVRTLNRGQGPISEKDMQRFESLYPALRGFDQLFSGPPERAREMLTSLQQQIARDSYVQARLAGQRPDVETISYLTPRFIQAEAKAGRITEEEARNAIEMSPYIDEITEIINERKKATNGRP